MSENIYNTVKGPDKRLIDEKRRLAHDAIDEWAEKKKKGDIMIRYDGSGKVCVVDRHDVV